MVSPFLEILKTQVTMVLGNLFQVTLPEQGGGLGSLQGCLPASAIPCLKLSEKAHLEMGSLDTVMSEVKNNLR